MLTFLSIALWCWKAVETTIDNPFPEDLNARRQAGDAIRLWENMAAETKRRGLN